MWWTKKYSLGQKRASKIDTVDSMVAKKTKQNKKKTFTDYDENLDKALKNPNTKMILNFGCKSSAANKNNSIKITRFFSGKMLMFAKLLLMSFNYELTETFYFPNKKNNWNL